MNDKPMVILEIIFNPLPSLNILQTQVPDLSFSDCWET